MSLNHEIALRRCVPGDEEALALVGAATFLETFAGLLAGPDILAHCREHLTGYKVPREVEFRTALPKSNVGKILRRELRDEAKKQAA